MAVPRGPAFRSVATGVALSLTAGILLVMSQVRPASAQSIAAGVAGVVTDETGARLPGVTVTVTNKANGAAQAVVTGDQGTYRAVALQPALYEISAELAGFAPQKRAMTLSVGADVVVDFKLTVASVQESVTVSGIAPNVEVSKSQVSSVVLPEQVSTLPTLGRNVLELAQLLPGTGPDNSRVQYFNPTKFGGVGDQRNGFTTLVDGVDVDDALWGSTVMNFTQDAVQEFRVFRNQFDAEYGGALVAAITVVTKSGTNKLTGSGFYFGRDKALNARDFFTPTKQPFSQQRYGGSAGGPIALNKTHLFSAYEYSTVDTQKVIALPAINPFAAKENGIFPSGSQEHMLDTKADHRFNDAHSFSVRYAYNKQALLRTQNVTSESNQIDEYNRTHSLMLDENWIVSQNKVNSLRIHYIKQNVGTTPHSADVGISRPSATTGQMTNSPQGFPRDKYSLFDTFYLNSPNHDLRLGGQFAAATTGFDSHFNERGSFRFVTDAPFDAGNPATWPFSFTIGVPGLFEYKSKQIGLFVQDTWRVAERVRLNLGARYDVDTNLRNNAFYDAILDDPRFKGVDRFISRNRGTQLNNLQPRLGATWDARGDGTLVLRGGFGVYVTRNRPWFQVLTENNLLGNTVTLFDQQLLSHYPDINAVLGGKGLDSYLAAGGVRSLFLISDDSVLPYSLNSTGGFGWQLNPSTSLDVDYVHDYGNHALGGTDRNLPASGPISAANPRPVAAFSSVNVMENYTRSWYDGVETQLRTRFNGVDNMMISYTVSRSYRDGVDWFATDRGTQRTPNERGYNNTDQRHNLTISAATHLPAGVQVSAIGKFVSGSPMYAQAGFDLDGDGSIANDRPAGLPPTVGRNLVDESLQIINTLRASRGLPPIDRRLLDLDPFVSLDMRITKIIRLPANRRLDLFLEGFNLTNHENFQPFTLNTNIISTSFLIRNSARPARQIQWGARVAF